MLAVNPWVVYSNYDVPADYTASYAFSPVEPEREATFKYTILVLLFVIFLFIKITDGNFFVKIKEEEFALNANAVQHLIIRRSNASLLLKVCARL